MKKHSLDLFVHKMNRKGQISRTEPYRLFIDKGVRKFEKPSGSGNFFLEDGTPIDVKKPSIPKMKKEVVTEEPKNDLEKEILG